MDEDDDVQEIVPQVYRNVKSTAKLWMNTQETPETEEKEEWIRTLFTTDAALKLAMAWIEQPMKMIQTEEFFLEQSA